MTNPGIAASIARVAKSPAHETADLAARVKRFLASHYEEPEAAKLLGYANIDALRAALLTGEITLRYVTYSAEELAIFAAHRAKYDSTFGLHHYAMLHRDDVDSEAARLKRERPSAPKKRTST